MTDFRSNIEKRYKLLQQCKIDSNFRNLIIEKCRRDIVFFCDTFVFTSDPRLASQNKPITIPFILFDKQKECLAWIDNCYRNKKFGLVAKSRDAGISYIATLFLLHKFLFVNDFIGGLASRKEMQVDRIGDISTLFGKLRFMLEMLPNFIKPNYLDGYMKLVNRDNNSSILGEAGSNAFRGSRASIIFLDEAAFIEHSEKLMASLSQTADCVIRVSTPNGSADSFAKDYLGGKLPTFNILWLDDPRKNTWVHPDGRTGKGINSPIGAVYPWFVEQQEKLDPLIVAREISCDFSASMEGICIPAKWVEAAIDFPLIMSNYRLQAGLDVATEGSNLNVFIVVDAGNKVTLIDSWNGLNTTETAFKSRDLCHSLGVQKLNFDGDGVGAGVAGTLQTTSGLRFQFQAMHGGSSPSNYYWVAESRSSKDKFVNRRAELWYLAREKFRKTYEMRNGIREYSLDDCISIPNDRRLITQLSQPIMKYRDNGKMLLESKNDMRKRGASSPDFADALIYALANDTNPTFVQNIVQW